jgi:hypothetical protein
MNKEAPIYIHLSLEHPYVVACKKEMVSSKTWSVTYYTQKVPPKKKKFSFYLPPLVQIDEKHYVITETGYSVSSRHSDDKGKEVINECIECLKIKFLSQIRYLYYKASTHSLYSNKKFLSQLSVFTQCF